MTTQEIIQQAILERKAVHLTYGGDPREVCPHAIGLREEALHVLVYQYAGPSRKGRLVPGSSENWRCMALDKISDVTLVDDPWQTAKNGERPQTCLESIIAETH